MARRQPPRAAPRTSVDRRGAARAPGRDPAKCWRRRRSAGRWYALRPAHCPARARARPAGAESAAASISSVQRLAAAISDAWPIRPKPVTSVHACTTPAGRLCSASAATRFSVIIERIAAAAASAGARSNLSAVEMMPVPRALVRSSSSPACAPAFDQTARRQHLAGDGVAELDLGVLNGVATKRAPRRPRPACRGRP